MSVERPDDHVMHTERYHVPAATMARCEGASRVVAVGNPGMATGGMGDLLTGVIAALCAQGLAPFDAAAAGVLLHGIAGDAAARNGGERGLLPTDLLLHLRRFANPELLK